MKEAVGKLKREADFVLPRTCKRPRSSVVYSKNSSWEYTTHRPRRSTASPEGLQSFLKAAAKIEEQEEEEDLDEIAMALLEMSSPAQEVPSSHLCCAYCAVLCREHLFCKVCNAVQP